MESWSLAWLLLWALVVSEAAASAALRGTVLQDGGSLVFPSSSSSNAAAVESCASDEDCSLNGKCRNGACACDRGWKGGDCGALDLLPVDKQQLGYRWVEAGRNVSSWGGAVVRADNGEYHMWAAEMACHCGINAWELNSRIVRASSRDPSGPYTRQQEVWPVFAHEPDVVRAPTGEYVMYFTAKMPSGRVLCQCQDGSTGPHDCDAPPRKSHPLPPSNNNDPTYMSWSLKPTGPWSTPVQVLHQQVDTNFAPVILRNGSLVGLWRSWDERGSRVHVARAGDWREPGTYRQEGGDLFPHIAGIGTEDPYVYLDIDGNFHAIFHHMDGCIVCGGHAYSRDGIKWVYGKGGGDAYGGVVDLTDGSQLSLTRRERPHLIFDVYGKMTHLTTSAQYGGRYGDATFTLVQPLSVDRVAEDVSRAQGFFFW